METEEKVLSEKRKNNMKLYSIHRMLTADLLFYYAIKFLFLTQIKKLTPGDIVLASAFFGIFKVMFQIPAIVIIDKIGYKKSIIIGDILAAISVILVMICTNITTLILANLVSAISFAIKEVAENGILNTSIPNTENKGKIFSNVDSKGLSNFYFISAISATISGFLFNINGYIPMCICVLISLVATRIAYMFKEIEIDKKEEKVSQELKEKYKDYFKDLKLGFSFIIHSRRLKALMIFAGLMYSIIIVMNTYEMGLLDEINLSSGIIGIIYASMQLIAGIASKNQEKIHKRFKNKTLTIIGISYTVSCLIAGIVSITLIPYIAIVTIIIITYIIRYLGAGSYYVLIKKYITNFTNTKMVNKVYSAYGIVTGMGNAIIGTIGALIVSNYNLKYSMIIFGIIFLIIMLITLKFMKTRVGLKPEEYRKKDINYKEYISLK